MSSINSNIKPIEIYRNFEIKKVTNVNGKKIYFAFNNEAIGEPNTVGTMTDTIIKKLRKQIDNYKKETQNE